MALPPHSGSICKFDLPDRCLTLRYSALRYDNPMLRRTSLSVLMMDKGVMRPLQPASTRLKIVAAAFPLSCCEVIDFTRDRKASPAWSVQRDVREVGGPTTLITSDRTSSWSESCLSTVLTCVEEAEGEFCRSLIPPLVLEDEAAALAAFTVLTPSAFRIDRGIAHEQQNKPHSSSRFPSRTGEFD